jgi:hypothetical protein
MARPKKFKNAAKINLLIERENKIKAIELANKRRISVGQLFENWLLQDLNGSSAEDEASES